MKASPQRRMYEAMQEIAREHRVVLNENGVVVIPVIGKGIEKVTDEIVIDIMFLAMEK